MSTTVPGAAASAAAPQRPLWLRASTIPQVAPYALVPILFGVGAVTIDGYATKSSLISMLIVAILLGLASVGQTLAVVVGGVDL